MQGGPIELADQANKLLSASIIPDVVIATDMTNLPAWLGLMHTTLPASVPLLLYMHENQLTYPWRPGEKPDLTYAMINWLSQLSATRVAFNSDYHRHAWFSELPNLLKHYPDYNHLPLIETVAERSDILPVGIASDAIQMVQGNVSNRQDPPLIIWNQRWEYDKRPDRFFRLLYRLQDAGVDFSLAVAGENFRNVPAEFDEAKTKLADRITDWGFVEQYDDYIALLQRGDLVISTADHEFFGVSILEAIAGGAFPLLPTRLSYPELIPAVLHPRCLYSDEDDLFEKARRFLQRKHDPISGLQEHVAENFNWPKIAALYDQWADVVCKPTG